MASFEDLLKKKLGPMADWVVRPARGEPAPPDPSSLYYRRAAGLEARVATRASWSEAEMGRSDAEARRRLTLEEASRIAGLTRWRAPSDLGADPAWLWRQVEADLLFWCAEDPGASLTGQSGVLAAAEGRRVARRASFWPTLAVETPHKIAPMPFMPRGDELEDAVVVGARFASLERGHEVFGLTITGDAEVGRALGALLSRLDGRRTEAEILESLGSVEVAKKLLGLLDRFTGLEVRDGPPEPHLDDPAAPQITWLGHGAVLIQSRRTHVLLDPIFYAASEPEERWLSGPRFDPRALPRIDAVLITHGDNDHLNPHALALLDRQIPVIVPKTAAPRPPYAVDIRGLLAVLGFARVVEIAPGEERRVGDLVIGAWPFEGESWDLELPKVTYLVEHDDFAIYASADAGPMDRTYEALAARGRKIDLALLGVSGNAESYCMPADLGYGNFYADWVPRSRHNAWIQHCAGPLDAARSAGLLQPRFAFGYASGGASYIRTSYSDVGDHDSFARALLASGAAARPVALPLGAPVRLDALAALPATSRL